MTKTIDLTRTNLHSFNELMESTMTAITKGARQGRKENVVTMLGTQAYEDLDMLADVMTLDLVSVLLSDTIRFQDEELMLDREGQASRIRFRQDGQWQTRYDGVPFDKMELVINEIGALSGISPENMLARPCYGVLHASIIRDQQIRTAELRVATIPGSAGRPSMLIRVSNAGPEKLEDLGLEPEQLAPIERALHSQKCGLILVAGPTNSGRSTTAQAMLSYAESRGLAQQIIECGRPVEFRAPDRTQVELSQEVTLKSFLDAALHTSADLLAVSDIRTAEELGLLLDASRSVRIIATIHATDAAKIFATPAFAAHPLDKLLPRLLLIHAQRLIRLSCPSCKGARCSECRNSGYAGRRAVAEVLRVTDLVRERITTAAESSSTIEGAVRSVLEKLAAQGKFLTMLAVAAMLVARSVTTAAEVKRVLNLNYEEEVR